MNSAPMNETFVDIPSVRVFNSWPSLRVDSTGPRSLHLYFIVKLYLKLLRELLVIYIFKIFFYLLFWNIGFVPKI